MPNIIYSGPQAAFSFDGLQIGKGQAIPVTANELSHLQKGKAFKSLVDKGEIEISNDGKRQGAVRGSTEKQNNAGKDSSTLDTAKAELKELGVTFSDDETLEQLQAKLAQAKE